MGQRGGGAIGRTREPVRRPDRREWAWSKRLGRLRELEDQDTIQKKVWSTG